MLRITFIISILLLNVSANSQVSGTIYFIDGTQMTVDSFEDLSLELVYISRNRSFAQKTKEAHDYQRTFTLEKLGQINFIYDKENSSSDFYYLLAIKARSSSMEKIRFSIKTWDWMEITAPQPKAVSDTRIVFIHKQKRLKFDRIIFN